MSRNNGEIRATVVHIDPKDIISTIHRIEELRKQCAEKEQAASKARADLGAFEQSIRKQLKNQLALLAEFEAELAELARRAEERTAREARIQTLRKQTHNTTMEG